MEKRGSVSCNSQLNQVDNRTMQHNNIDSGYEREGGASRKGWERTVGEKMRKWRGCNLLGTIYTKSSIKKESSVRKSVDENSENEFQELVTGLEDMRIFVNLQESGVLVVVVVQGVSLQKVVE